MRMTVSSLLMAMLAAQNSSVALGFSAASFSAAPRGCRLAGATAHVHALPPRGKRRAAPATGLQHSSMLLAIVESAVPALSWLPLLAFKTVISTAHAYPLLVDSLFAGLLYVLGKLTSNAIQGKKESPERLNKWFICGLVDGVALHAWYSFIEVKFAFLTNTLHKTLAMNGASSAFFTPAYCVGFLVLLSLLEKKGIRGAMYRTQRDGPDLVVKSVAFWGLLNMPLFLLAPLHLRVIVSANT